jgi:amidophosphoribosyltransferase
VRHRRRHLPAPVNQLIYDALLLLQHRGQDAAGIVTMQGTKCFMHKARGMVRDVFRTRNMRALPGSVGLGQVRYPTAGNAYSEEEAQPFYVNAPFGIVLVHNGNLTNAQALKQELFDIDRRHINTESDTEVLINVLAHELELAARDLPLTPDEVFKAVAAVHRRIKGSYAVIALIAGHGLLAFRDPYGIRPLCLGEARPTMAPRGDGGQRVGGARRHRPQGCARRGAGRGHLHRPRRPRACAPVRRAPALTPACSSTSTWRGPIR